MDKSYFSLGIVSHKGYVKKINQDNILIKIGENGFGEFGLFVVADGMGGLVDGHIASRIVIEALGNWWENAFSVLLNTANYNLDTISNSLTEVINLANNNVLQYGEHKNQKLGTTLSLILVMGNNYIIKHIGDSRIYFLEDDMELKIEEHSWVAEQVSAGKMTLDEAECHKNRNALTRCIGVGDMIEIYEDSGKLSGDEIIILCSDGLYKLVDDPMICNIINTNNEQEAALKLLELVKKNGATDNVSIIIISQNIGRRRMRFIDRLKRYLPTKKEVSYDKNNNFTTIDILITDI